MSEARMPSPEELLELVGDAVLVVDRHGRLLHATRNCADLLGFKPEEMIGTHMIEHVHPDDRGGTLNAVYQVMKGQGPVIFQNRWRHKRGHDVPIQWSSCWSEKHGVRVAVARAAGPAPG
jgi:PAS domain S-box-containing protein